MSHTADSSTTALTLAAFLQQISIAKSLTWFSLLECNSKQRNLFYPFTPKRYIVVALPLPMLCRDGFPLFDGSQAADPFATPSTIDLA